jgi:hypothetical protein
MSHLIYGSSASGPPRFGGVTRSSVFNRVAALGGAALGTGLVTALGDGDARAGMTARDVES